MTRRRIPVRHSPGGRHWRNVLPGEWRHYAGGDWRRTYTAVHYTNGWRLIYPGGGGGTGAPARTLTDLMVDVDREESRLLHVLAGTLPSEPDRPVPGLSNTDPEPN